MNSTTHTTETGDLHTPGRDVADVAKQVRKDIRAAIKAGALPEGLKVSVRISRFSMGQSIDATIVALPSAFQVLNPERVRLERENDPRVFGGGVPRLTAQAAELLATLEGMIKRYGRFDVDTMTDYWNVSFYVSVNFAGDITRDDRAGIIATIEEADALAAELGLDEEPATDAPDPCDVLAEAFPFAADRVRAFDIDGLPSAEVRFRGRLYSAIVNPDTGNVGIARGVTVLGTYVPADAVEALRRDLFTR